MMFEVSNENLMKLVKNNKAICDIIANIEERPTNLDTLKIMQIITLQTEIFKNIVEGNK